MCRSSDEFGMLSETALFPRRNTEEAEHGAKCGGDEPTEDCNAPASVAHDERREVSGGSAADVGAGVQNAGDQ